MQKKLLAAITALLISIILAFWWLNETAAQIISIFITLLALAGILALNIERPGMRTVLLSLSPVFIGLCNQLGNTPIGVKTGDLFTQAMSIVYKKIGIQESPQIEGETALIIIFFAIFAVVVLFMGRYGQTAMGVHHGKDNPEFQEKNFLKRSQSFCVTIRQQLERINTETDWNESYFTPVQAEVEVNVKGKHKKKYMDLLTCLKRNRQSKIVFLVLGDPGSGKSVSLRKLCLDLLKESRTTKKIPVYINLKKWGENWSLSHLPQAKDLISFIKRTMREGGDVFVDDFLDDFFDKMLADGRWYFVFDSFDEMPCLMGRKNCHELIDHISQLLYQFLTSNNQSGGIIASRLYRAPSQAVKATKILRIQEFSDIKIHKALDNYLNNADEVSKALFGNREDLVTLCRNPFYLSLLSSYVKEKGGRLPKNQMDLYSNFVEGRLKKCAGKIEEKGLTMQDVHNAAKQLALYFQDSPEYGLECPTQKLYELNNGKSWSYWQKTLEVLEYAKLCRIGGSDKRVSFVHRRFQEFFLVEAILEQELDIDTDVYKDIVHDAGMRDALVLYCEVSEEKKAQEIAEYCWRILQKNVKYTNNIRNREAVIFTNILYFMTEAFRNRRNVLLGFLDEFQQMVISCMNRGTDYVVLQALTNSMALFEQSQMQKAILQVFKLDNRWLNDTIVKNCRLIHRLDYQLESRFAEYFFQMDMRIFLERFSNTHFSLSLSKNFRYIRIVHICIFLGYMAELVSLLLSITIIVYKIPDLLTGVATIPRFWEFAEIMDGFLEYDYQSQVFFDTVSRVGALTITLPIFIMPYVFLSTIRFIKASDPSWSLFAHMLLDAISCVCISWLVAMPSIFVRTSAWTLLVILISESLIPLIHDSYFALKSVQISRSSLSSFFSTVVKRMILILVHLTMCCLIFSRLIMLSLDIMLNILSVLVAICFGALYVLALALLLLTLIRYFQGWLWIRRHPNIQQLDRTQLAKDLYAVHSRKWRRTYVEQLLDNKVALIGDWPYNYRPTYGDDSLERVLAKLDCADLELDSNF